MCLQLTVHDMANATGDLFRIALPGGRLLLGRVVSTGYMGGHLSTAHFREYESYGQFEQKTAEASRNETIIHDGQFIIVQRVSANSHDQPSHYDRILELESEIQQFADSERDYGIIINNLPDKLDELKVVFASFHEEQPTGNPTLAQELLEATSRDCRSCPPSFGQTLEQDRAFKINTIRQAKYYARQALLIGLSQYAPADRKPLPSVWKRATSQLS